MNNQAAMRMLTDVGKIVSDTHVVFSSGQHGNTYINKDALYVHVPTISELCKLMSVEYDANSVDVAIGPTMGGAVLAQWLAYHLNSKRASGETLPAFAEKIGEGAKQRFVIKRGYDSFMAGKKVVVVDDLITTGATALKVIKRVRALKGEVLALSVICNRGGLKAKDVGNVPIHALVDIKLESWSEDECPLCKEGVPINLNLGSGKAFLKKRGVAVLDPSENRRRKK